MYLNDRNNVIGNLLKLFHFFLEDLLGITDK